MAVSEESIRLNVPVDLPKFETGALAIMAAPTGYNQQQENKNLPSLIDNLPANLDDLDIEAMNDPNVSTLMNVPGRNNPQAVQQKRQEELSMQEQLKRQQQIIMQQQQ